MDVVGDPVIRVVGDSEHCFDTEDCARLYGAAFDAGMLEQVLNEQGVAPVGREHQCRVSHVKLQHEARTARPAFRLKLRLIDFLDLIFHFCIILLLTAGS